MKGDLVSCSNVRTFCRGLIGSPAGIRADTAWYLSVTVPRTFG